MTKAQKKRLVQSFVDRYARKLNISHWSINIIISNEKDTGTCAKIKSDHRYMFATITVYPESFVEPNDIEDIIRHELCHCLTDPLYKYCYDLLNGQFRTHHDIEDQRELLTERIAKLL